MHIPDGFLDTKTWAALDLISAGTVGYAVRQTSKTLEEKSVPIMGVLAAFIFAAQMLNFPVFGGTSGHLLGAALAVIMLGFWPAILVMTAIFVIQALFFQDGGLLVLGANVFNMAIAAPAVAWCVYSLAKKIIKGDKGILIGTFAAAWATVVAAALLTALELALSGTTPLLLALASMLGVHAVIGIGEAIITTAIVAFVLRARRDLVPEAEPRAASGVVMEEKLT
jgi:cobalt/nickel transport system permease protein